MSQCLSHVSVPAVVAVLEPLAETAGPAGLAVASDLWPDFGWLSAAVETATGWPGVGIIVVYSFLIAFALPGVSEVVLLAPLNLGLGEAGRLTVIILSSAIGKAAGSVFAFHIGQEVKESGPVIRFLRNSRFDVVETAGDEDVGHVADDGLIPALDSDLCDASAHRPGADDPDGFDRIYVAHALSYDRSPGKPAATPHRPSCWPH